MERPQTKMGSQSPYPFSPQTVDPPSSPRCFVAGGSDVGNISHLWIWQGPMGQPLGEVSDSAEHQLTLEMGDDQLPSYIGII